MLGKLAFRNVRRSVKDYLVYVLTMTFVTALMFAFNSILFSKDVQGLFEVAGLMAAMVGVATFFIVLIVAWLINYMVKFMLEKRSQEFGIYLLLGMKKKKIAGLYMRENLLMGTGAFFLGMLLGMLLQQIIMSILYSMIQMKYDLHLEFNRYCILMTAACYAGCYLLALFRCRRRFKKMNINDLMNANKQNEEIKESNEKLKRWLLPVSILFMLAFGICLFCGLINNAGSIILFLVGLILVIYLFYTGLSSWIICYVRAKGKGIYKGQNLFLLRQFSSKLKTMRFTMGTLTSLFTIAFLGCSIAMMFSDWQNKVLVDKFPFDVQVYSNDVNDDFQDELKIIGKESDVKDALIYHIYTNQTNQANTWLYTHLDVFGDSYLNSDGSPNLKKIEKNPEGCYCDFDTYMGLSDYNHLRKMLGYKEVSLSDDQFAIHIKQRLKDQAKGLEDAISIDGENGKLRFAGCYTEAFSQDGHNGGDYVIIVPDQVVAGMTPYYSELVADIGGKAPEGLVKQLDGLSDDTDFGGHVEMKGNNCYGTDTVVTYNSANLVRDNLIPEVKYMLSSIIFPLIYMGLVFLCVALTVLSVHQLSDSAKYKFRYGVLKKIGLSKREVSRLILKQLFGYYLCPALFAALISGIVAVFTSNIFIFYTGVGTSVFQYFAVSLALFMGIYILYFLTTYVGFKRNVESREG